MAYDRATYSADYPETAMGQTEDVSINTIGRILSSLEETLLASRNTLNQKLMTISGNTLDKPGAISEKQEMPDTIYSITCRCNILADSLQRLAERI